MATPRIPYEKPTSLLEIGLLTLGQLRVDLSSRIHNLENRSSTDAFMDVGLCYFDPGLVHEVTVRLLPTFDIGSDSEFTGRRRRIVESVVCKLREEGAIAEHVLRSTSHYCGKFRICLGRGCDDPVYLDRWLIPVRPAFFWGGGFPNIADPAEVMERRRLTGLAAIRWVAPLGQQGRNV